MSLRILAIGDLHIQPDNLADINVFLQQLEKCLQKEKFDLIVNLGDTLHTHEIIHTQCLNKMFEYVAICQKYAKTLVLIGNHEYINNQQFLSDNHPFNHLDYVIKKPTEIILKDHRIVLCPYVPDGRLHEALDNIPFWKESECVLAHQLLDGAKMGAILAKNVEKWEDDNPLLVCGHIHDKQRVKPNLYYTGSSIQVSFGESEDHTISSITLNKGQFPIIDEINIHPPKKKTIYADMSKLPKIIDEENVKVKLSISGDAEEFKTFKKSAEYKDMVEKGVKIVFKQKKHQHKSAPKTAFKNFHDILFSLIEQQPGLLELYREVIPGGNTESEIVFVD